VPTHGHQNSTDRDGRQDETPALQTLANPGRIRWATRPSENQAG
jgi:hypothetical protein